jgi:hypothetical protein
MLKVIRNQSANQTGVFKMTRINWLFWSVFGLTAYMVFVTLSTDDPSEVGLTTLNIFCLGLSVSLIASVAVVFSRTALQYLSILMICPFFVACLPGIGFLAEDIIIPPLVIGSMAMLVCMGTNFQWRWVFCLFALSTLTVWTAVHLPWGNSLILLLGFWVMYQKPSLPTRSCPA